MICISMKIQEFTAYELLWQIILYKYIFNPRQTCRKAGRLSEFKRFKLYSWKWDLRCRVCLLIEKSGLPSESREIAGDSGESILRIKNYKLRTNSFE